MNFRKKSSRRPLKYLSNCTVLKSGQKKGTPNTQKSKPSQKRGKRPTTPNKFVDLDNDSLNFHHNNSHDMTMQYDTNGRRVDITENATKRQVVKHARILTGSHPE